MIGAVIALGRESTALGLIDLAIRENIFDDLLDALFEALNSQLPHATYSYYEAENIALGNINRYREELISNLSKLVYYEESRDPGPIRLEIIEALDLEPSEEFDLVQTAHKGLYWLDPTDSLIHQYLHILGDLEQELVDGVSITEIISAVATLLNAQETYKALSPGTFPYPDDLEIYRAFPYAPLKVFSIYSLLLAPFYYLIQCPFWPPSSSRAIQPLLEQLITNNPVRLSYLAAQLNARGIHIRLPYLRFILLNDERFLFVDELKSQVARSDGVINDFLLYAKALDRKQYSDTLFSSYTIPSDDRPIDDYDEEGRPKSELVYQLAKLNIYHGSLRDRIFLGKISNAAYFVDWIEVGAKMYVASANPDKKVQGLPHCLHAAIVNLLFQSKIALAKKDIERRLGFAIDIDPESLPPGRIMAYSRHPRFHTAEGAFYVLRDWVETDTEKKGRIPRDRIVTPFEEKDIAFTDAMLNAILNADPVHLRYGIISAHKAANEIGRRLPSQPRELYYQKLIREKIASMLKGKVEYVGSGFFITDSSYVEKIDEESFTAWRKRILSQFFDWTVDLREAIENIEDTSIKHELFEFIR